MSFKGELILKFKTVLYNVAKMKVPNMPGSSILSEETHAAVRSSRAGSAAICESKL